MGGIRGLAVSNFVVIRCMGVILFLGGGEMTEHAEQPARIVLCDNLELVKYYPYYQRTLAWYQDPVLCRQVEAVIYSFNNQSRKAFEAAGFQQTGRETYRCIL